MEDGNCYEVQTDNLISCADNCGRKPSPQGNDKFYNLNGNGEGHNKVPKQYLSGYDSVKSENLNCTNSIEDISRHSNKKRPIPVNSDAAFGNNLPYKPSKKPFVNQQFKVAKFKTDNSKGFDDCGLPQTLKENGNHIEYKRLLSPQVAKHTQSPKTVRNFQGGKHKFSQRRTKPDGSQLTEYAQYLGLQPTIKFKCSKCCCTSFESLGMLKEHQRSCSSQASLDAAGAAVNPAHASGNNTNFRITRKVYLCSACGTYYENWNLFLHIREVHKRHICLFCLGMFSQAHKLATHLVIKHNIQENHFASKEDLFSKFSDNFFLMCCKCEQVFMEKENFIMHECTPVIKYCSVCKLRGNHKADCPKNSKHKLPLSQPQLEFKKMKRTASKTPTSIPVEPAEHNLTDIASLDASSPGDVVSHGNHPPCDILSDRLQPEESCHAESPCPPTVQSQMNNLHSPIFSEDNLNSKYKATPKNSSHDSSADCNEPCSNSSERQGVEGLKPNLINDEQKSEIEGSYFPDFLTGIFSNVLNKSKLEIKPVHSSSSTDSPHTMKDVSKIVSKPPARNRRPPKRYQVRDSNVDLPSEETFEQKEVPDLEPIVNKVPKLTVKVPKILPEKDSSSEYSSESEDSDKLTVDYNMAAGDDGYDNSPSLDIDAQNSLVEAPILSESELVKKDPPAMETEIVVAGEDIAVTELTLDQPLDRFPLKDLLKVLLSATVYNCIYCNHARKIAVNGRQLGLHFIAQHRFSATVDSITAEELLPETIVMKIRTCLDEVQNIYLNMEGYDSVENNDMKFYDHTYECFQCYMRTTVHKELYLHNRKMHQKTILLCIMCKSNFYSYSELLCHLCPGMYMINSEIGFRCCLCQLDSIPSAFRLMVHLRKRHHACDVCLETCHNQSKLSNHVWKHKLHHLCYRCGIAYRNKPDITKHLFWKHGTESVLCKKCLQKKWPHVYHFCIPPTTFVCEECNLNFTKAVSLKVHKRIHSEERPYTCSHENCTEKFISKKILLKHENKHLEPPSQEETPHVSSIVSENIEKETLPTMDFKDTDSALNKEELNMSPLKVKKPKKSKKHKDSKDNLLIDVNLPALNLSESDSSDESEAESSKKVDMEGVSQDLAVNSSEAMDVQLKPEVSEETKPEPPVVGIWDNFKMYQAEIEKSVEQVQTPLSKPKHVCESDHDYCVLPPEEISDKESPPEVKDSTEKKINTSKENRRKLKTKKKNMKKSSVSSSSDSSSESDSSCSCGTNCSCSSSSNSSSSSSSSSESDMSSSALHREKAPVHKDSDASHTSAVDIMATEESPSPLVPDLKEIPVAESDLDTDETETDEDFYDEHPQRLANKILAEKRNQLMLLATVAPINNGSHIDSSRPPTPEDSGETIRKKVKTKKKKKEKKTIIVPEPLPNPIVLPVKTNIPIEDSQVIVPNKITISLQSNTVQVIDTFNSPNPLKSSAMSKSESDKRASKRRRVPNRFYGYSSDEEYLLKPQLPPKLEWRKEDLPSPSGPPLPPPSQPEPVYTPVAETSRNSEPPVSPKLAINEPTYVSSDDSDSSKEGVLQINHPYALQQPEPEAPVSQFAGISRPLGGTFPFPRPAGARQAREGESVYCYCRCPYDEVSEMIACDGEGCNIEWFHFECVGIMVPPKGKWFCPDCRQRLENSTI